MSSTITIKHANHKIFPVMPLRKLELLKDLLKENQNSSIAIFSSDISNLQNETLEHPNLTFLNESNSTKFDIVISYDIHKDPQLYLSRVAQATQSAFLLLLESEQNMLYPIEVILGRAIKQEVLEGFGYLKLEKDIKKTEKTYPKKEKKTFNKSKKESNKFLGYDENGKAKFSGKSGDRNHRYDGTPRTNEEKANRKNSKTFKIKELKKRDK